ncbi:hypothetical protein EBI01_15330 [Marinomonas rhizomae]|uniref:Abortive infection AbiH-like protein n=1 Tax=Marinomonas rhizomae TaxID=491948 RepID=A0A366IXR6_9GAMM|nr:bacteriophage abortive infection AbiH family protein [Marinomonas rhizomae]RBP79591.1 abortive infection AbiH-like protein [Marinomonas rhizomae]RNF71591.1 hypothetical protein EBI01_15330 [Marinomonas rhizomae]
MKKLYVIGNGFDLHHGLNTSFLNFKEYLRVYNVELLNLFDMFYYSNRYEDLWSNFEYNLANLDKDNLLDHLSEFLPVISSDDFSDRDWHASDIECDKILGLLTKGLRINFKDFIIKASIKKIDDNKKIKIDSKASYISFNYTKTLEKEYCVDNENIFYIHGIAYGDEEIILGHATDPNIFKDSKDTIKIPEDVSDEYLDWWYSEMSSNNDTMYEELVSNVNDYFLSSYKNTQKIIEDNSDYFKKLSNVEKIFILGHSMSDVDISYFEKIAISLNEDCIWYVSYYDKNDYEYKNKVLGMLDIDASKYQLIDFKDLPFI